MFHCDKHWPRAVNMTDGGFILPEFSAFGEDRD